MIADDLTFPPRVCRRALTLAMPEVVCWGITLAFLRGMGETAVDVVLDTIDRCAGCPAGPAWPDANSTTGIHGGAA